VILSIKNISYGSDGSVPLHCGTTPTSPLLAPLHFGGRLAAKTFAPAPFVVSLLAGLQALLPGGPCLSALAESSPLQLLLAHPELLLPPLLVAHLLLLLLLLLGLLLPQLLLVLTTSAHGTFLFNFLLVLVLVLVLVYTFGAWTVLVFVEIAESWRGLFLLHLLLRQPRPRTPPPRRKN